MSQPSTRCRALLHTRPEPLWTPKQVGGRPGRWGATLWKVQAVTDAWHPSAVRRRSYLQRTPPALLAPSPAMTA